MRFWVTYAIGCFLMSGVATVMAHIALGRSSTSLEFWGIAMPYMVVGVIVGGWVSRG